MEGLGRPTRRCVPGFPGVQSKVRTREDQGTPVQKGRSG
jgi:hypothetical protein